MGSALYKRTLPVMMAIIMAATVFTIPLFSDNETYAQSASIAQPYKNTITSSTRSMMAGKTLKFAAKGDRQSSPGLVNGDTKYIPYKWELDGKRDYKGYFAGRYSKSITLKHPGKYELEVEYRCYQYRVTQTTNTSGQAINTGKWVYMGDDYDEDREIVIRVKGTIKFNVNKGKRIKTKSKVVTPGKRYGKLPKPKRAGYKFKGWYTKKYGGSRVTSARKVSLSKKTTTLYAKWKKKSVKKSTKYKLNRNGYIGKSRAKQIARKKAGGGRVTKCHFDWDDGRPQYEIEIWRGNWEYDIDVHARTGRILDYDRDYDDDYDDYDD